MGQIRKQITAVVMRESEIVKNIRFVHCLYAVHSTMSVANEIWLAVPHSDDSNSNLLLWRKRQIDTQIPVEETISTPCKTLTRSQRFPD